ncbi:hypothetical protein AB205_0167090 [Aquarana catesbeiana]|uniref:Anaphase-promoting complex subunit 5 n=1 Tax=Aquarana catesbeiana TaxID=8400 RepID=A0A2G9SEY5_AQUCT|nr:hypothetical protein AB205_0167090 [Aquarana catesbeiana]
MALQQAQMLLTMNSLDAVNVSVQQNNTEPFAVVLCHLAELHAEQGCFSAASEILKHLKERFPPGCQHAKLWMLFDQKIQFNRAMNDGKYHLTESLVTGITALDSVEGLYRKAVVLKAQNQTAEAHKILQVLLTYCQKVKNIEMVIRSKQDGGYHTTQKQALNILHMAIEPILAHGAVLDKGRAMFLVAKCQVASAASYSPQKKTEALESAILNLNEAKTYFGMVDCKEQIRDILYLQARLYNSLGRVQERNKCSMLFRQIHQELPSHGVSLLLRL